MNAIGIDLGGTKMEAQVFDDAWSVAARRRREGRLHEEAALGAVHAKERQAAEACAVPAHDLHLQIGRAHV